MAVCTHKSTTTIKKQCFGAATSLPFVTVVLPFLKRHLNVIIQYMIIQIIQSDLSRSA